MQHLPNQELRVEIVPPVEDVASIDSIVAALYESISGPAGMPRDWDRLRRLFHPGARLLRTEFDANRSVRLNPMTVEEFIALATPFFGGNAFYEREIARRVDRFGHIAQVFSTYEASAQAGGGAELGRGINSIQLWFDGTRWWVLSLLWDDERPGNAIPADYSG